MALGVTRFRIIALIKMSPWAIWDNKSEPIYFMKVEKTSTTKKIVNKIMIDKKYFNKLLCAIHAKTRTYNYRKTYEPNPFARNKDLVI